MGHSVCIMYIYIYIWHLYHGSIHRSVALSMNYELSPVAIHSLQRLHVGVQEWQIYINSKHNYSAGGLLHRCVWVWGFLKIILLLGCRFLTLKGKSVFRFRYFSTDPRNRNTLACIITHFLNNVNVTYKACTAIRIKSSCKCEDFKLNVFFLLRRFQAKSNSLINANKKALFKAKSNNQIILLF